MATVLDRYSNWCKEELRAGSQVNQGVWLAWYNKGLQIFQKNVLEYVSGRQNTSAAFYDTEKDVAEYSLPLGEELAPDFYSIIQLRVAYHNTDKYSSVKKYSKYNSSATYYNYVRGHYIVDENPEHDDLLTRNYYVKDGSQYVLVREHSLYNAGTTYYNKIGFDSYELVTNPQHDDLLLKAYYVFVSKGYPLYRVCKPISLGDYNIRPTNNTYDDDGKLIAQGGRQTGEPMVWGRISELNPRYVFTDKNHIKIFPTPIEGIENGISLNYNYMERSITLDQMNGYTYEDPDTHETITVPPLDENDLNLPRYFFDAIEDYITFRLYQAENPEMAQWYYQQFESTLHDNIYGLNKDKRPVDEGFADLRYFYHY